MPATSTKRDRPYLSLVGWLALPMATGVVGALGSLDAPVFYQQLSRPAWAPPAWLFGPAWTVLYFLMGFAAWLVWRRRETQNVRVPLTLFGVQLVLNALWSWMFFEWRAGGASVMEVVALAACVAATLVTFWRVRAAAGALLIPYLAWVMYAAMLTASVVRRNPTLL